MRCFLRLKSTMILCIVLVALFLGFCLFYAQYGTGHVHPPENHNKVWLSLLKNALLRYHLDNEHFPPISSFSQESTQDLTGFMLTETSNFDGIDIRHPTGSDAREFSWRVQMLPYLKHSPQSGQILAQISRHADMKGSKSLQYLTETPDCFRIRMYSNDYESSLILMLPPSIPNQMPVLVGVRRALFNWYENGDIELWNMLNAMPDNAKLYEVRNDILVLCDENGRFVPLLAADGNVYCVPVTTTVGMLKDIIDAEKIKELQQTTNGRVTYFKRP